MRMLKPLVVAAAIIGGAGLHPQACRAAANDKIAGSPMLYAIDKAGFIRDRDRMLAGHVVTEADTVTLTLNTLYLRYIKKDAGLRGNELLVYTEVFDDPTSGEPYRTVVFNERHQAEDSVLGVVDRVIYGPTRYKGHPLRVKLYVVELDKKDNETTKALVGAIGRVVSSASLQAAPLVSIGTSIADVFAALNDDDFELRADITFHPHTGSAKAGDDVLTPEALGINPSWAEREGDRSLVHPQIENAVALPLREGQFALFKAEYSGRRNASSLSTEREYLAGNTFTYDRTDLDDGEAAGGDRSTPGSVEVVEETEKILLLKGGYLWLDTIEREGCCWPCEGERADVTGTEFYDEKTYAIFAVRAGGAPSDPASIKKVLDEEWARVGQQLQTSNDEDLKEALATGAARVAGKLDADHVVGELNAQAARNKGLRDDPKFVLRLIDRLDGELPDVDDVPQERDEGEATYVTLRNQGLLSAIESTTLGFPLSSRLDGNDFASIDEVKGEAHDAHRICPLGQGLFRWQEGKKDDLAACPPLEKPKPPATPK